MSTTELPVTISVMGPTNSGKSAIAQAVARTLFGFGIRTTICDTDLPRSDYELTMALRRLGEKTSVEIVVNATGSATGRRDAKRLCEIARTVNDAVVGTHIGQLCRDMATEIEQLRVAMKGAAAAFDISASLHMEQKRTIADLEKLVAEHRDTAPLLEPGTSPLSIVGAAVAILNARRKRYGLAPQTWDKVSASVKQSALDDAAAALGIER